LDVIDGPTFGAFYLEDFVRMTQHALERLDQRYGFKEKKDINMIASKLNSDFIFMAKIPEGREIRQIKHNKKVIQAVIDSCRDTCISIVPGNREKQQEYDSIKKEIAIKIERKYADPIEDLKRRVKYLEDKVYSLETKKHSFIKKFFWKNK